ncbi:hypothetical protein SAMN05661096_03447 [Marivirga sericea]|uniref:Outer membrane protein beta-barrel domain-containing protein n=1 Tax=Marivirga sericea TaxID=1028 RepID=A0A1X7L4K0_9BACT|nr:hypothetical protein [Marivirga sericea]SMG48313.1 hypothetical protein SAMN05661096_03447 [Marivirga sericea]
MKNTFLLILAAACIFLNKKLYAQESEEVNTLLDSNSINTETIGFFIVPTVGLTQMDGSTTSLLNVRAGISLKDEISFGAYFSTALNEINPESETIANVYMDYWTVGAFAEYTLLSKKVFHLSFPFYAGYGEVQMDNENGDAGLGEANFLQIEPSALLEVNLHKNVRFNLGGGYRFIGEMDYRNFNQSDISGLTAYIGLKIGLFK